jgi:transposase
MKPYPPDLRERILHAIDQGQPRAEVIRVFGVSRASIKRYLKQRREIGHLLPKPIPGRPPKKFELLRSKLQGQLEAYPHATLEEHCQLWEAQEGVKVSTATMSRAIQRLGVFRR